MKRRRKSLFSWQVCREVGDRNRAGDKARIESNLANSVKVLRTWEPKDSVKHTDHGGVFNFDFSQDGSILGVACERKSILMFDAFSGKMIGHKLNAHTDCVNCVKFLDNRMLATCSDDTTVALWDIRFLKHNIHVFRGHSNWVKNIEYASAQGLLLTSGFDGCIYTWDINRFSESDSSKRVFYTSGLMRSKLSSDASKLLISTHEGYIIVIHNLDLEHLAEDLDGFKPKMYRLMQRSQTPLRIGLMYNHVFKQERNRVEFLADWPTGNDANIISSLQVHPQGWCALSRNTDTSDNAEWTCVHDIQDYSNKKKKSSICDTGIDNVTPHTSSSYCSSTNSPAFSSVASSSETQTESSGSEPTSASAVGPSRQIHIESPRSPDSLIQIRRGPPTGLGQFQFSVSVHTSSGQTIQINNTDLEDSDSEPDIQVTPFEDLHDAESLSGSEYEEEEDEVTEAYRNQLSPSLNADISAMFNREAFAEILTERALRERAEIIEGDHVQDLNSVGNSGTARATNVTRTSARQSSSASTVTQSSSRIETQSRSRRPVDEYDNRRSSGTINQSQAQLRPGQETTGDSQQRPGSLMFLLQSAAGQRILNLSYMGGYTETENSRLQKEIYQNSKRLLAYTDECNVGRGFIKELCFSADGRLICSPFGYGLRLFSFDPDCNELCDCVPSAPVKLYEITCSLAHANFVVASKFSPVHHMAVSGCLDGRIAFHQPVL